MLEYYYDNDSGEEFEVLLSDLEEFKLKYPKAEKLDKDFNTSSFNASNMPIGSYGGALFVDDEKERARKNTPTYKADLDAFYQDIQNVYDNDIQAFLDGDETLQNVLIGKGGQPVRNPEENIKQYYHDKLTGFGLLGQMGLDKRELDPATGQTYYSNLTNRDIDEAIETFFDKKLQEEKTLVKNSRIKNYNAENYDIDRGYDISSFTGTDLKVANLVEDLLHGDFTGSERDQKIKQFEELKASQKKFDYLFNFKTGELVVPSTPKEYSDAQENEDIQPLDTMQFEDHTIEELENEYRQSLFSMSSLNEELDKTRYAVVDNLFAEARGDIYNRVPTSFTLRDWIENGPRYKDANGNVFAARNIKLQDGGDYDQLVERTKDDLVEYTHNHEAIKRMYLLNDGILNVGSPNLITGEIEKFGTQTALKSFVEPFIGRYGTLDLLGGPTEREVIDKQEALYGELGFELDDEQKEYIKRDIPETINEGFFGSGRILLEFYGVGKVLRPIETATGLTRYMQYLSSPRWARRGKTISNEKFVAQAKAKGYTGDAGLATYAKRAGYTSRGASIGNRAKAIGISALMEGGKFEAISRFDTGGEEGGFATGFGFGAVGRTLAPLTPFLAKKGYLKDINFTKAPTLVGPFTKRIYTPGNLSGQALFQQFAVAPASFVAGSEMGEIMHGLVDDAFGNKQFSQFMDEHYGDFDETGKRIIANYFIGVGFGMAGPHGSMFKGFADFKSKEGLRKTLTKSNELIRGIASDAGLTKQEIATLYEPTSRGLFSNIETKRTISESNKKQAEVINKLRTQLTQKQKQRLESIKEIQKMSAGRLSALRKAEGYMDPMQADAKVRKDLAPTIKNFEALGYKTVIEVINNTNLKKGQTRFESDADIVIEGKTVKLRFNAERYTPDLIPHEVGHGYFEMKFGKDAMFKAEFLQELDNITKQIKIDRVITEAEATKLREKFNQTSVVGENMTLSDAIKLDYGANLSNSAKRQKIVSHELFGNLAEYIGQKRNYEQITSTNGFSRLKTLINKFSLKEGQRYNLTQQKDIVRWFRDYAKNTKKGLNTFEMFEELENVVINKKQATEFARREVEKGFESKDLDTQKNVFLENQKRSFQEREETPLYTIDKHVFDSEGNKKYETLDQFKASNDYAPAYEKIFGEKGVFDLQIKEGMTEKGVVDQYVEKLGYNPMNEFVRNVKESLLPRFYKNFNPKKGGGSLYGYFSNIAVPYEKTRAQEKYVKGKKEGTTGTVSLDKLADVEAAKDTRLEKLENENILKQQALERRDKAAGITRSEFGEYKHSQKMGRDKNGVETEVLNTIEKENINLDVKKPNYKEIKKWLVDQTKIINKQGKAVIPTKSSDVRPIGHLQNVMRIISEKEYGIPFNRLLANQTLSGKMRDKARDYIRTKITEIREGVFPEGETPSGVATGVANTSWAFLYNFPGGRGKFAEGKTAAGKPPVTKRKNITNAEVLEKVGINPETGQYAGKSVTKFDNAIKELIKLDATMHAQEALRIHGKAKGFKATVLGEIGAGRAEGYQSKNLENANFADKVNFFYEVQSKSFDTMLRANIRSLGDNKKALQNTLVDYFTDYKNRGNDFNIDKSVLKEIAKDFSKNIKSGTTSRKIASAAAKTIELPNDLKNIERQAGLSTVNFKINDIGDVVSARVVTKIVSDKLIEKYGDGVYEALLARAEAGGKGVGSFRNIADMIAGVGEGRNRFSLYESNQQALDYHNYKNSKGKEYTGFGKTKVGKQGDKARQLNELVNKRTGDWDVKKLNESYEVGEFTKKVLKDAVETLREAYKNKEISHVQARQWIEIHAGTMSGLIKLSGSFSLVPTMSAKQMFKMYGKEGSNYVLEHTTPAQYVKARIYDYIINGGSVKKSNMNLVLKDYHTTLIPKVFDTMVNKVLKSDLPSFHKPGMDPVSSRYYEFTHSSDFTFGLRNFKTGKVYSHYPNKTQAELLKMDKQLKEANKNILPKNLRKGLDRLNSKNLESIEKLGKALRLGKKRKKNPQGMSTFDFDETLIVGGKNFVTAKKGKEVIKISSAEWPVKGAEYAERGYSFDFKDFVNVRGGTEGPLLQKMRNQIKKFGPENVFVLTARQQQADVAIHGWLKSQGINIPLKNITGLGNSTGEAKALWMAGKFSEGYNDMYFVDDALSNVKAVRDILNQLDVKSNVQQVLQAKNLDGEVNNILEYSLGIASQKRFSKAEAKVRGKDIKRRRFFMPDKASDLELLLEPLFGKGKKGIKNQKWFQDNFVRVWERNINDYNNARQAITSDYMALRKNNKDVVKLLSKPVPGTSFTHDVALRVYIWQKAGFKIPDLAPNTQKKLFDYVVENPRLQSYAESLKRLTKVETGLKEPSKEWWGETIATEISDMARGVGRKKYIQEFIDVRKEIFSEQNLNKMESKLGTNWRNTIEDMFDRMETGRTRRQNLGETEAEILNYLNGSVGTIMNFNTRSAILQLISTVNFVNSSFNNPLRATAAFANQPQYWKDFMFIMNSDMLKQRRAGLEINVTEAELVSATRGSKNKARAAIAYILKKGYLPTKFADSFAIASGGATFYRNRIKHLIKTEGLSTKEAERRAFIDFQEIAQRTQQSSRADLLSQQQTSLAGRIILPFANTPLQMNRIMIKKILDVSKGRYEGFYGENSFTEKMGQIGYYGFVQTAIFAGLQSAAFAVFINEDDDDKKAKKAAQVANTVTDSFLRGMGIQGAVVNGVRIAVNKFIEQKEKGGRADYGEVGEALLNISPSLGSKISKLDAAGNTYKYNRKQIEEEGFTLGGPAMDATLQTIEAITNAPVHGVQTNVNNVKNAMNSDYENWQRILSALGWSAWSLGIYDDKKKTKKSKQKTKIVENPF